MPADPAQAGNGQDAGGVTWDVPGVTIRPLRGHAEFELAVALQREIWGTDFSEIVPVAILWATQRIGGVVSGAFDEDGRLLGLVFGLTGLDQGRPVHWSDMLAVRLEQRGRGLSMALKSHQRAALIERGIEVVGWSFDPLESRNAHINFARLGVTAREYVRDLYGGSSSPLHDAVGTDRLLAEWRIASSRVARRMTARERPPTYAEISAVPVVNPVVRGEIRPRSVEPDLDIDAPRVRLVIPARIQELKSSDSGAAVAWRTHTRAAFEAYLGRGYRAIELVRGENVSDYLLEATQRPRD
jgi:predicted GNAT superfamily acetyltransferase